MTEAEWLESEDPALMGDAVLAKKRASARVLRLYMAAFWSWQAHRLDTEEERELLRQRAAHVEAWADSGVRPDEASASTHLVFFNQQPREGFTSTVRAPAGWNNGELAKKRAVWALHEVFGNPFTTGRKQKGEPRRGWQFDRAWRTDTVVLLAQQMYDSRDFGAMPILADALQDAGCDNTDILNHCRKAGGGPGEPAGGSTASRGEHVRGCWVLDLLLEKK